MNIRFCELPHRTGDHEPHVALSGRALLDRSIWMAPARATRGSPVAEPKLVRQAMDARKSGQETFLASFGEPFLQLLRKVVVHVRQGTAL